MQRLALRTIGFAVVTLVAGLVAALPAQAQQDTSWAKERLEKSPRHHDDNVKIKHGDREVSCFITYPEVKDKAQAVIVIHEIFGLTDWVRGVTDQLAEAGYIAIAPDLLWGKGPGGEGTDALLKNGQQPTQVIGSLPPAQITDDLNAIAEYVTKLPSCNGKLSVCGFCWGGAQSFRYATNNKDLKAAYVFYGQVPQTGTPPNVQPDKAAIARIACPVFGFYAGNDARIGMTIPDTITAMKEAGKTYEPVTYEGAGHGFMRAGEQPNPQEANKKAREEAWVRWKDLLKKN